MVFVHILKREQLRRENQQLRIKFSEADTIKESLEREISSMRMQHEGEVESVKLKLQSMNQVNKLLEKIKYDFFGLTLIFHHLNKSVVPLLFRHLMI